MKCIKHSEMRLTNDKSYIKTSDIIKKSIVGIDQQIVTILKVKLLVQIFITINIYFYNQRTEVLLKFGLVCFNVTFSNISAIK